MTSNPRAVTITEKHLIIQTDQILSNFYLYGQLEGKLHTGKLITLEDFEVAIEKEYGTTPNRSLSIE